MYTLVGMKDSDFKGSDGKQVNGVNLILSIKSNRIFDYLFISSQMPLSLDFPRVRGIFTIGGSSHILSKVFRFSLSKVVRK